jgi:ribosomal protein S18 acetylase RimI-like enzyme
MSSNPEPGVACPDEWPAALDLLFGHCPEGDRGSRIARARAMLATGEIGAADLIVLRHRGDVVGAVVGTLAPGRTGLVWPPRAADGPDRPALEDQLARYVTAELRRRGACLAQALLPPDELSLAAPLLGAGYRHVTALWFLRHRGDLPPEALAPVRLTCVGTRQADPEEFAATLLRTYQETLDCPEVTGLRSADEVLAGHRAQGRHDPDLWWLARDDSGPVGAVLLTGDSPDTPGWEVAYVGIVPEARRRGYARELILRVLLEARAAGVPEVFLTVDARNGPGLALYRLLGFEPFDRREVLLYLW